MKRYTIYVPHAATAIIRGVSGDDSEDAINEVDAAPTLCSSCAEHFDINPDDANWEAAWAEREQS